MATRPATDVSFGSATNNCSKASAATIRSAFVTSINAAVRYFQVFNSNAAPQAGNIPLLSFPLPAGSSTNPSVTALGEVQFTSDGLFLDTGLSWGLSTTNGTFTAATASDHHVNILYN